MKLNFNFSGKTLLKDWWGIVRDNFLAVQNGHNSLKTELDNEVKERQSGDSSLNTAINNEANTRQKADEANAKAISDEREARVSEDAKLRGSINTEIRERSSAQKELERSINGEITRSKAADTDMQSSIAGLQENAHTHSNKSVIDAITADDVDNWNGIKSQVTKTELDAATEHFEEIGFSLSAQFAILMNALGIVVYDGGWFGEKQEGVSLDGGAFEDENLDLFDCGGFEPISIGTTNAVTDGGTY